MNKKENSQKYDWLNREIKQEDLPLIYQALSKPFPKEAIQKSTVYGGREIIGLKMQFIIDRLNNDVGLGHWDYDILELTDETIPTKTGKIWTSFCKIRLSIGNYKFFEDEIEEIKTDETTVINKKRYNLFIPLVSHTHVGGCVNVSRYECKKGSVTNAFKKCSSMFSIGSEIWTKTIDEDIETEKVNQEIQASPTTQAEPIIQVPKENKDVFSSILTALNSVKDIESFINGQTVFEANKGKLNAIQLSQCKNIMDRLEMKYGK